jgi:hypothetical protein
MMDNWTGQNINEMMDLLSASRSCVATFARCAIHIFRFLDFILFGTVKQQQKLSDAIL